MESEKDLNDLHTAKAGERLSLFGKAAFYFAEAIRAGRCLNAARSLLSLSLSLSLKLLNLTAPKAALAACCRGRF